MTMSRSYLAVIALALVVVARVSAPGAAPSPPELPPPSSLPRLRPVWSAPGVIEIPSVRTRTPVRAGIVLAWAYDAPTALVALDLRTGKQRWRMPMPNETRPDIVLAGDLALVYRSIGATAVELATGKQRWTERRCAFKGDLQTFPESRIGVGLCALPLPEDDGEIGGATRLIWSKNIAVAINLATGRELWRVPTGWPSGAIAAASGVVYVATDTHETKQSSVTVSALDPRTGKALRSFLLPHVPDRMHILSGERALFVGASIVAASLTDGRVLWEISAPPHSTESSLPIAGPELRAGRLLAWYGNQVREVDPRSGADIARWDVPDALPAYRSQIVRPGPRTGLLVIKDREREPALALRFADRGAAPTFAVMPVRFEDIVALEDDLLVVRNDSGGGLRGYSAFDTIASEATDLDVGARVRAILERQPWRWGRRSIGRPEQVAGLAELRSVEGFAGPLAAIAGDLTSPLHDAALDAVALAGARGAAPVLLAEVFRPLGLGGLTGDLRTDREKVLSANNVMLHRSDLIASLADLDEPTTIERLTALLFEAESASGFGQRDWEIWGGWVESGYGKKSWAASESPESAFSRCLQAPAGRPEAHAAIYRLLARQGRPSDLEALRRFDAARGTAGGWEHVCDADDGLAEPYVDHALRSNGLGLCRGWDAGGYRVTQSEALWLRRRLPNGSFGPPAWALDPGGDTILDQHPTRGARLLTNGKVQVSGNSGWDETTRKWTDTIDPAVVFADRDGDGLTDLTEVAFGTDPGRADTDGDGTPDGRDPAPLAARSKDDVARVQDEVVRFLTTFRLGGPVSVYADRASWGGGGGVHGAGVVLHRPPAGPAAACDAYEFCEGSYVWGARARHRRGSWPAAPATEGKRRCEMLLSIERITVHDDKAEATAAWPSENGNGFRIAHELELRKLDGTWRVTEDRGPTF